MKFFALAIVILLCVNGAAQSATDHLLWFSGKKLKEKVLLTPAGDTIFYTPSKGILKVSSGRQNNRGVDKMRAELDNTSKRIKETIQRLSPKVPKAALPMLALQVKYGYESVQRQYKDVLDNRLLLPEMDIPSLEKPIKGPNYQDLDGVDILKVVNDTLEKLEKYMEAHKNEVFNSLPVPPRKDFSYCAPCQPQVEENYNREMGRMEKLLLGDDFQMIQLTLATSRVAALIFGGSDEETDVQIRCSKVKDFLMVRYNKRVWQLYNQYGDDPYRIMAVVQMMMTVNRYNQLIGCSQPIDTEFFDNVKYILVKFLHKVLDEKDYSIALNLQLIIDFSRTCQLLLGSFTTDVEVVDRALKFNRFKMNIHISGKIGANDGYQLAELKAGNWFMAIPDSTCKLRWLLIEPLVNKMEGEIVASDWRGRGVVITYAGPKKWVSSIPKMRMDFCKTDETVKDTIDIYQFDAEGFDEKWNIPKMGVTKVLAMNNPLMNTFFDMDQLRKQAEEIKNDPKLIEKMQKEMMAKYQQMAKNNQLQSISAGNSLDLQKMEAIAKLQQVSREITDMIYQPTPNKYHFEPVMHNKQNIIVDEKLNGKELFPENAATQYAWFFLKIEHDPNGKLGSFL